MTKEELNDLKREHNKLRAEGCELWERIEVVFERVIELRKQVEAADPDDYDPIRLIFAGDFEVEPKFASVSCSQCGQEFGPGDHGFSHCENHWNKKTPNVLVQGREPVGEASAGTAGYAATDKD